MGMGKWSKQSIGLRKLVQIARQVLATRYIIQFTDLRRISDDIPFLGNLSLNTV